MNSQEPKQALEEIKQIMNRSSRFVSLSGLSGIAAGICALVAAWAAKNMFDLNGISEIGHRSGSGYDGADADITNKILMLAGATFIAAMFFAILFTYIRSKRIGVPIWGFTARKVVINVVVPMLAGGLFIWRLADFGSFGFIAPACLIFYGIALINGSKFTLAEVRYLGYAQLILGIINLWFIGYGLYFWAAGFGLVHIIYGIVMWNKYERKNEA